MNLSKHRIAPFLAALVVASGLAAQEPSSTLFVDRVDVNVVNVEVWVTDKSGRRVRGLERQDFEILEDGVPVEITNFYATSRPKPWSALDEPRQLPADEPRELPADQMLHLVVLVDHFNTLPANRNRALDRLAPFIEDRVRQGDRVMLMGYDRALEVVEPFTQDYAAITDGLARLRKAGSSKAIREAERNRRLRGMITAFQIDDADVRAVHREVRAQVQQEEQELRETARALERVVQSLSGLPGRKAVLYISDGLPKRPGEGMYEQMTAMFGSNIGSEGEIGSQLIDPFIETLQQDQTPLFNRIARSANAHQVTLYAVDTRGATGDPSRSPANPSLSVGAAGSAAAARTLNYQETLLDLSDSTGGTAVLGTFNYDTAITRVAEDFDTFYSLGFVAEHGGDGRFHKLEVRVKQPGLSVRHRRGYVDKPAVERVADRTLSSLMLDVESNPLAVAVDFGDSEKVGRKAFELPVLIRLPLARVTLLPTGEAHEGRLRIFLAVKDADGRLSDMHEFEYPVAVPAAQLEEALAGVVGYTATLRIAPGLPEVVVGVWDEISGVDSFVHKQVRVGDS